MDILQERFLRAIYETQNEAGRSHVIDIALHLGLDIIDNKGDRDLYREATASYGTAGTYTALPVTTA